MHEYPPSESNSDVLGEPRTRYSPEERSIARRFGPDPARCFYRLHESLLWAPLRPIAKLLLIDFFHRADKGVTVPCLAERAALFGVSVDTVERAENEMIEAGYLLRLLVPGRVSIYLGAFPAYPSAKDGSEPSAERKQFEEALRDLADSLNPPQNAETPTAKCGDHPPQNAETPAEPPMTDPKNQKDTRRPGASEDASSWVRVNATRWEREGWRITRKTKPAEKGYHVSYLGEPKGAVFPSRLEAEAWVQSQLGQGPSTAPAPPPAPPSPAPPAPAKRALQREAPTTYWEEFLGHYPPRNGDRETAKGKEKFYTLLRRGISPSLIIDGARRYRAWCDATGTSGTQFVKQITTWLNGGSWDELYEIRAPSGVPKPADDLSNKAAAVAREACRMLGI